MSSPNATPRSDAQRAASRTNGRRSLGPSSPQGKRQSSRNALRHGLRASTLVLANEDAKHLQTLIDEYSAEFLPQTSTECDLISEMAFAKWRQFRAWLAESGEFNRSMVASKNAFAASYAVFDESVRTAVAVSSSLATSNALDFFSRTESRCNRQFHRALNTFLRLRELRERQQAEAATPQKEK